MRLRYTALNRAGRKESAKAGVAAKPKAVKQRKPSMRPQTLQVFQIVRRLHGRKYVYPRLTLEGGNLRALGLSAGQTVLVECSKGEIRIRPQKKR